MSKFTDFCEKAKTAFKLVAAWLASWGVDKYLHLIAGAAVTGLCALIPVLAPFAATFGVVAGVLKEILDHFCGGSTEASDAVFTAIGAFLMQVCIWGYLLFW